MWHTSTVTRRRALGGLAAGVVASGSFGFVGLADQHEDDGEDDGDGDGDDETEAPAEEEPGDDPIEEDMARVRAVHAAPDVMDVDVWVQPMDGDGDEDGEADDEENGEEDGEEEEAPEPALSGLSYRDVSRYVAVEPGAYTISIGEDFEEPAIELDVEVEAADYTVAAVGESATDPQRPLEALVLADDNSEVPAGMSRVRLLHASPDAPAVDVTATAIGDAAMADGDGDGDEADAEDGADGADGEEGVDDIGDGDAEDDTEDGEGADDGVGDGDATGGDGEEQTLVQGLDFGQHGYVEVPAGDYRLRVYGAGDGAGEDMDGDADEEGEDDEDMDGEAEDGEADEGEDMDGEAEDGEADDGEDMDGDAEDGAAERGEPVLDLEVTLEDGIVYSAFAMGYVDLEQAFVNAPLEVVVTEDAGPDEYRATPPEEDGTDAADEDSEDVGDDVEDDDEASADGEDDAGDDDENGENDLLTPLLG